MKPTIGHFPIIKKERDNTPQKHKKQLEDKEKQRLTKETARRIALDFSLHTDRADTVFTIESTAIVRAKLEETLGYTPQFAVEHEYGEVLNHFGA